MYLTAYNWPASHLDSDLEALITLAITQLESGNIFADEHFLRAVLLNGAFCHVAGSKGLIVRTLSRILQQMFEHANEPHCFAAATVLKLWAETYHTNIRTRLELYVELINFWMEEGGPSDDDFVAISTPTAVQRGKTMLRGVFGESIADTFRRFTPQQVRRNVLWLLHLTTPPSVKPYLEVWRQQIC